MAAEFPLTDASSGDVIRSGSNRLVRYIRSLQRRSVRHEERAFVVEGDRAVRDALASGASPIVIALREDESFPWLQSHVPPKVIGADIFQTLCDTAHPQGILAVFSFPTPSFPDVATPLYVIVDRISDPGNLGTLLRSAAAAGVDAVVLSGDTVDHYNPKVVRAAMGAHFRVPISPMSREIQDRIAGQCELRVLADLGAFASPDEVDWRAPATLIVASETAGPSEFAIGFATRSVTIPMHSGMDSLNAAVAGSVILFEAARQRRAVT